MGQLARNSERNIAGRVPLKLPPRPPREGAAYEWKYFVLALAALIGLGVGWLSGEAVTGWLPDKDPPLTVAERATPATNPATRDDLQSAPPTAAADDGADSAASTEADESGADVAQATNDEPPRAGRRAVRHPRRAHGQFFFKPFKVFRKLKIW